LLHIFDRLDRQKPDCPVKNRTHGNPKKEGIGGEGKGREWTEKRREGKEGKGRKGKGMAPSGEF